ncbi:MAG: SDR family NAD(P)-dependent oxidoreductase [Prolixibacteraceae bacterium]|nr:SDR family NAD(P)-dependent oxidoreductase [Prolixibacteraceae bacterium]
MAITNRTALITGATSGIGKTLACSLGNMGFTVIATARNMEKGEGLIKFFEENYPQHLGKIEILYCDMSSFESVQNAVKVFGEKHTHLDLLINNAGTFNRRLNLSKNNIEETLQVNLLSPLLLTHLLLDTIGSSPDGRVIFTTSLLHFGRINFNDIEGRKRYFSFNAYRQTKLGLILATRHLACLSKGSSTGYYSYHPGIVSTNLGSKSMKVFKFGLSLLGMSPQKGAETAVFLATAQRETLKSGEYYFRNKIKRSMPHSTNMKMANKLMEVSHQYLKDYIREPEGILWES